MKPSERIAEILQRLETESRERCDPAYWQNHGNEISRRLEPRAIVAYLDERHLRVAKRGAFSEPWRSEWPERAAEVLRVYVAREEGDPRYAHSRDENLARAKALLERRDMDLALTKHADSLLGAQAHVDEDARPERISQREALVAALQVNNRVQANALLEVAGLKARIVSNWEEDVAEVMAEAGEKGLI